MGIVQTTDYELVARLNKPVHELHHRMYPAYFKAYSYESIKEVFKEIIHNPDFIFLVINDGSQYCGYAWKIHEKKINQLFSVSAYYMAKDL